MKKITNMTALNHSAQVDSCLTIISIELPKNLRMISAVSCIILSIFTILSNTVLIYTLYKTGQLKTISNKLILVMSISDLGLGVLSLPAMMIAFALKDMSRNCAFEQFTAYFVQLFPYFSFFIMSCIAIDRYFQVTKMNRYSLYMNSQRMKALVLVSFVLANAIALTSLLFTSFGQWIIVIIVVSSIMICTIIVYISLQQALSNHVQSIHLSTTKTSEHDNGSKQSSKTYTFPCSKDKDIVITQKIPNRLSTQISEQSRKRKQSSTVNHSSSYSKEITIVEPHKSRLTKSTTQVSDQNRKRKQSFMTNAAFHLRETAIIGPQKLPNKSTTRTSERNREIKHSTAANPAASSRKTAITVPHKGQQNQLSATRTIRILIIFMFFTYAPFLIASTCWTYYKVFKSVDPGLIINMFYSLTSFISALNASGNACIIIYGNKRSRTFLLSIIRQYEISKSLWAYS